MQEHETDRDVDVTDPKSVLAAELAECRERTLELIAPLSTGDLYLQHDRIMSPVIWDIGHIGNFEELWTVRSFPNGVSLFPEVDTMYDALKTPRAVRNTFDYKGFESHLAYLDAIRGATLRLLEEADISGNDPLLRDGYVYRMILQHEYQHNETILATLQLKQGTPYVPAARRPLPEGDPGVGGMVLVPAGEFFMGTEDRSRAYDNERSRHVVHLDDYLIDRAPVSNGEFMEFVEAGGYRDPRLWSEAGWSFIGKEGIEAPKHWERNEEGTWITRSMDLVEPVDPRRPVIHVCWHEADAYSRWAGKRLPTEAEWEKAASWNPEDGGQRTYPWGEEAPTLYHANLDQLAFGTARIGAYPAGISPVGCHQMIGDVWEWTSSDFLPYPGFTAFPYDEYSKVFFGDGSKVLRGGSWATRPGAIRNTFRNWDFPIRRQIFAGFRCAKDL